MFQLNGMFFTRLSRLASERDCVVNSVQSEVLFWLTRRLEYADTARTGSSRSRSAVTERLPGPDGENEQTIQSSAAPAEARSAVQLLQQHATQHSECMHVTSFSCLVRRVLARNPLTARKISRLPAQVPD